MDSIPIKEAVTCQVYFLKGYPLSCVVIGIPDGEKVNWKATLPNTSTKEQIEAAIRSTKEQPVTRYAQSMVQETC